MKTNKAFPLLIAFYEMVTYLSNDMYLPALPQITHDLGTTHFLAQLSLTVWFFGATSMQLFLGPLSDRYGRRPILLWSGLIFILATTVCATTSSVAILLIVRFIQGCSVCAVTVAGYSAIHELYDQKTAIKAFALMGSITVLAPAFGPIIGSLILKIIDWRGIFWLLSFLGIIALGLLYKGMPETLPLDKRHAIEVTTIARNYGKILSNPLFMLNSLAFCSTFAGIIAWIAMGPFLVITAFHYSPMVFGILQALIFGSFIIGARFIKIGLDKLGINKLITLALVISFTGAVCSLIVALILPQNLFYFAITLMIFSFGNALSFSSLQRQAIEASTMPMGTRMAILSSLLSGFGTIGSFLAGYFYSGKTISLALIIVIATLFTLLILGLLKISKQKV